MRHAAFIHSAEVEKYSYPPGCPFKTQRATRTREILDSMGLLTGHDRFEAPPAAAGRKDLERFHTARYLDVLKAASRGQVGEEGLHMGLGSPDCPMFRDMYDYPVLAAGGTLTAARLVLDGQAHVAFNPSGGYHHAGPEHAAGFCYINDVALACLLLADTHDRVMFLDMDVHHCDGVQDAFYGRRDILTLSLHESGKTLFPGTGAETEIGAGEGRGYTVNVPLPVGTYDEAYVRAFSEIAIPLIHAYDPGVIVMELGMDALAGDPLAHLNLTNNAYAEVVSLVMGFGKPLVATGGGGYNVDNATRGWALAWSVLCGETGHDDMAVGLGGVMLESTEWHGGLRDRALITHGGHRDSVDRELSRVLEFLKREVFPLHGI